MDFVLEGRAEQRTETLGSVEGLSSVPGQSEGCPVDVRCVVAHLHLFQLLVRERHSRLS